MDGGTGRERRRLLLWILSVCGCLWCQLVGCRAAATGDVVFINRTNLCVNDEGGVPGGVNVSVVTNNSAVVHWNTVVPVPSNAVQGYEVLYWPTSGSWYSAVSVAGVDTSDQVTVQDLSPYTRYLVAVRLRCSGEFVGLASPSVGFTTEATEPGGNVSNVSVSLVVDSGEHEANISWTPLSPGDWNGIPYRYYVYVFMYSQDSKCGGTPKDLLIISTFRNVTSTRLPLADFCYRVIVFPVNHKAWGPGSDPLYFTFTRLPRELKVLSAEEVPQPTSPPSTPFLSSPFVYILVVGVLALVPVVFGIVLCKKARERKSKVQYVRGIHGPPFGDIQMYPLSPMSGGSSAHLSPHAPTTSRVQGFSPLSNPSPVTPSRPLLSSPMAPHIDNTQDHAHFMMPPPAPMHPPPVHSPTSPKFPSSGVGGVGGGVSGFMGRNFNLDPETGDVFAGGAPPPPVGIGPHRPRANTEGGAAVNVPNPYEFPVHPGGASTLPRGGGSGTIPPPPSHAPPPLTQSSLEIFARVSRSPPGNGAGRGAPGQRQGIPHRSFSTTHASSATSAAGPVTTTSSMRAIRSTSHLRPLSENDPDGGPDYATVEPPDYFPPRKASTLDRYPPAPPQHLLQQQQLMFPNVASRTRRNSDELSSFSEMTPDNDSVQLSSGGNTHGSYRHPETGAYRPGDQRESVFSETSTEQSISSGSIREASPTGAPSWVSGTVDGPEKRRLSSSSVTPTNSRSSHNQLHHPPTSPSS